MKGLAVVLVSGDMGFKIGMGAGYREALRRGRRPRGRREFARLFRQQRTPAEIQKLIADAARRALAFGKADRLMMIGQSFGSDMMHVGLTGLPRTCAPR